MRGHSWNTKLPEAKILRTHIYSMKQMYPEHRAENTAEPLVNTVDWRDGSAIINHFWSSARVTYSIILNYLKLFYCSRIVYNWKSQTLVNSVLKRRASRGNGTKEGEQRTLKPRSTKRTQLRKHPCPPFIPPLRFCVINSS